MKLKQLLQSSPPVTWQVTVFLESDLAISSGTGGGAWVDKVVVRDADGLPYIPGSHLKGVVRDAAERLAPVMGEMTCFAPRAERMCPQSNGQFCIVCKVFGCPQRASSVFFGNLRLIDRNLDAETLCQVRNGVSIDRWRRTALPGRLFSLETVPRGLTFQGTIALARALADKEKLLLKRALAMVESLGGNKSRGLGKVTLVLKEDLS